MNMGMRLMASSITKSYGTRNIINNCSYSFDGNAVYVIMGNNGAGKSTLLRMCSLLEAPDSGEIIYMQGDSPVPQNIHLKRRITMVLPETGVFNSSVFDNVAYGLKVRGISRRNTEIAVRNALDFVGLGEIRGQAALSLSTGEKKRLGIARALAVNPEVLFLDEPTASVDQDNIEIIESILLELKSKKGTMIIITTHDSGHAEKLADIRLTLENGKLSDLGA
ncbi:ATP-binding cassette domain-containing protein [Desulforegula conservatrix]|uniref:ATP-binding cassette domain-containing protein n=1 Tax=Desulforegula conservatrix TaxID=153026 RepID=UPI0004139F6A|nr:ATP-binding cassette domain-containing protein [Desulforegula conservatrix]